MRNMLIASKNINFVKKINNSIDKEKIIIIKLCTKYDEIINYVKLCNPEIILLELDLTTEQVYSILDYPFHQGKEPVVFINSNIAEICNLKSKKIYFFSNKTDNNYIVECLSHLTKDIIIDDKTEKDLEERILSEMLKMGFEMKNQGDIFLLEAIKCIKKSSRSKNDLKNDIYPAVSKKLNIPIERIKWNIIYSINCTYSYKSDIMEKYWKHDKKSKPTAKFIIFTILKNL